MKLLLATTLLLTSFAHARNKQIIKVSDLPALKQSFTRIESVLKSWDVKAWESEGSVQVDYLALTSDFNHMNVSDPADCSIIIKDKGDKISLTVKQKAAKVIRYTPVSNEGRLLEDREMTIELSKKLQLIEDMEVAEQYQTATYRILQGTSSSNRTIKATGPFLQINVGEGTLTVKLLTNEYNSIECGVVEKNLGR